MILGVKGYFKDANTHYIENLPGGTVGYPAQPRLIHPSSESVSKISFNYYAANCPGPTILVKYSLKIVN